MSRNILLDAGSTVGALAHELRNFDAVTAEDGTRETDHAQTRLKELMTLPGNSTSWPTRPSWACARSTHGPGSRCPRP